MNAGDHSAGMEAVLTSAFDCETSIASLRAAGAERFDPVRLHYIEALARRATMYEGNVRRMLDAKLAKALAAFKEGFDAAQRDAMAILARNKERYPQAADELQQFVVGGDFKGLRRYVAVLQANEQCASLSALVRRLEWEQPAKEEADVRVKAYARPRPELRTIRNFRHTWSRLSVDKQLAQALEQAPKNAGPINSHMLVLRSLEMMRDISPAYLTRFMSYADTLLCLDQGEKDKPVSTKRTPAAARTSKNKPAV